MDFTDPRQVGLVLARARAVNGLVMLLVPGLAARVIFGSAGSSPVARTLLRLVGVRDLVLGVGAITTLKEGTMDAEWVGMGAVADGVDALVCLLTPGLPMRARATVFVGGSAAVQGLLVSRALADGRRPVVEDASELDA